MNVVSDIDKAESAPVAGSGRKVLIPFIVAAAFLLEVLDATILTTSIPTMALDLGVDPLRLHLAITVYMLSLAVFIPLSGWLADRFGAKRVFCFALGIFVIGSVLCGASQNFDMLIASRALQGFGGAMMTPIARLILLRNFERQDLVWAMSYMVTPVLIAPLIGPLIGGFITTYTSWRWIFYVNVPIGAVAILLTLLFIPKGAPQPRRDFDLRGFVVVAIGFAAVQVTIENLSHPFMALPLALAVFLLIPGAFALYGWLAARTAHPALDITVFRIRAFRIGVLAGSLARIGMNGLPFLLTLLFQLAFGLNAIESGSIMFISAVGALTTRPLMVPILRTFGFRRIMLITPVVGAAITAGCALFTPSTPHAVLMVYLIFQSLVTSIQFNGQNMLVYSEVPPAMQSRSVSIAAVAQQISMGLGISVGATLLSLIGGAGERPDLHDFQIVFLLMAIIPLFSLIQFRGLKPEDGAEVSGWRARTAQGQAT